MTTTTTNTKPKYKYKNTDVKLLRLWNKVLNTRNKEDLQKYKERLQHLRRKDEVEEWIQNQK